MSDVGLLAGGGAGAAPLGSDLGGCGADGSMGVDKGEPDGGVAGGEGG